MYINEDDDLDADLKAAFDGPGVTNIENDDDDIEIVLPEGDEGHGEPAAVEEKGEKGRVRGPDGKFVAKTEEQEQDAPVQDPNAPAEPSVTSATRPPASWTPEAKAQFATLSPVVQAAIAKREQEIDQGLRMKDRDVKRYEPLEQTIAPYRQKWAVAGVDEATAIKQLLAASDWLERDPAEAIAYLAKQYGVASAQPAAGQPQQAQPQGISQAPEFTALQQELASLKQQISSQSEASLVSQIEAFRNDPANLYFENVRDDMAALINAGKATDLADAYEKACWMRPDIRPLLQQPVVKGQNPAEVARKKAAGGSVTGSPAEPVGTVLNGSGSIEDDIRAAIAEAAGRV